MNDITAEKLEEIARNEFLRAKNVFYDEKQPLYAHKDHDGLLWLTYQSAGPFMHHQSEGVSMTLVVVRDLGALNYIFVNENDRKKGYGKLAIEIAEEIFKKAGCAYSEAKADKEFAPFLTGLGYKEEDGFYRKRW
jgi:GNAT superfamily N-acetyltransferase